MPRLFVGAAAAALAAALFVFQTPMADADPADGVVRVRSSHPFAESVERLKKDIAAKGILLFFDVDQQKLAADAGITTQPSTLIVFGNPPLGTQFITANPNAGLDWPVRLLVTEDEAGSVWVVYTDFEWIKRRHRITSRDPQFKMASEVIASIASSVTND